jgi:lipid II:glycine glycyltransferase (peptidoglycan interpeptide bridge formation enzyme)
MGFDTDFRLGVPDIGTPKSCTDRLYAFHLLEMNELWRWNRFVEATPGGHHVQTSHWAQVKSYQGWRALNLIATRDNLIVGGAQILIRRLPLIGRVGYIHRGPLLASRAPGLTPLLIAKLKEVARQHSIQCLIVHPPVNGEALDQGLHDSGFRLTGMRTASLATVVLDLGPDEDSLLSGMKPKTRYNVQLSQRKGIRVREGAAADLPIFQKMLEQTAVRQNFSPNSASHLANMCRILTPAGQFKLFIAEFEGRAVSGLLAVPFRDTVIYKRGAWSGQHGNRRPNEALHWAAIRWAKSKGFRYYDFDGIQARTAKGIVNGEPLPDSMLHSVTRFKLGFGGRVVLLPGSYSYICHPLLRWGYQRTFPLIAKSRVLTRTLRWARAQ